MDILFIGHSLVEFFDWQERFPAHRITNLGVAGESVEGLLSRVGRITSENPSADLVLVMSGLNNIAVEDLNFFDSYGKIIKKLSSAYPDARIAIHSILPVLPELIPDEQIRTANVLLKGLAEKAGALFIDIYGLFINSKGEPLRELFVADGVHLSAKGYGVWSDALRPLLNT